MVYWLVVAAGMVFWVKNTSFLHQTAWTTGIRRGGGIFVKTVFLSSASVSSQHMQHIMLQKFEFFKNDIISIADSSK